MEEIVVNLHAHTVYSDGWGDHEAIAQAALRAGLDVVGVTDHNVWVDGVDGYRYANGRRVLLVTGEEIHDPARQPQKNHLLVYEARRELAALAGDLPRLLEAVEQNGGLAVLAHPVDPGAPGRPETDLSWVEWDVPAFHGLEIWNFMTEFKSLLRSRWIAALFAFNPSWIARGPFAQALRRWDSLLATGRSVVALGGADAHAFPARLGLLRRTVFPYEFLFQTVNTHVLLDAPLVGNADIDRLRVFQAIRQGRCFVGYDLPAPTRGFQFQAQGDQGITRMGGRMPIGLGATLQISSPRPALLQLVRSGKVVRRWNATRAAVHVVSEPGAYRVEAFLPHRGAMRGWIFSNPIYLTA
ncbi:MAG TPA: CehA/McbA family metallohydrolase [Anaerolineales bacterium]|nr:CehA/McbA family metallohydrolase [Anaerolineales bacterium]